MFTDDKIRTKLARMLEMWWFLVTSNSADGKSILTGLGDILFFLCDEREQDQLVHHFLTLVSSLSFLRLAQVL